MKTYSEAKRRKPFDWNEFLSQKDITENQWQEAHKKALSWVTCACGNQCSVIARHPDGQPCDSILAKLGGNAGFYSAIHNGDVKLAKFYLKKIEKRSAELIKMEIQRAKDVLTGAGVPHLIVNVLEKNWIK